MPATTSARVIDHDAQPASLGQWVQSRLPQFWLRGVLAGAEAALGSWLAIVVPAVATYVATAADPQLGSASWVGAARVGTAVWLLGHGATLSLGAGLISVVPLGVTLLAVLLASASVRRARLGSWAPIGFAIAMYAVIVGLLTQLAAVPGVWTALAGGVVVPALGAVLAMRRQYPATPWLSRAWVAIGAPARLALRAGGAAALGLIILGAVAAVVAVVDGFGLIVSMHEALDTDPVSTAVIILADLLLLPTLILWATAFLLGPGFSVGADTLFAPGDVIAGPLPAVPILGALPDADSILSALPVLGYSGIIIGLLWGWWLHRHTTGRPLWMVWVLAAGVGLVAASLLAVVTAVSAGSLGAGRMAQWGSSASAVGLSAWWQIGLAAALVASVFHPATAVGVRVARARALTWWRQVRNSAG